MVAHAIEPLEDPRPVVGFDAGPVVADRDDRDRSVRPAGELDPATIGPELEGVRREVGEDLLDPPPVAGRRMESRRRVGTKVDATIERDRQEAGGHGGHHLGDREGRALELQRARFEARELEEVTDESRHRADDRATALEELTLHCGIADASLEDQVEVAGQSGQRRPQFVRHGRHESLALGLPRVQFGERAGRRQPIGHQGQCDRRVAGHRRRKPFGQDLVLDRSCELEAEGDLARGWDRQQPIPGAACDRLRRRGSGPMGVVAGDGDRRRAGGRAPRATSGSGGIQPRPECEDVSFLGIVVGGDRDASDGVVGDDRRVDRTDCIGEQVEQPGESRLGLTSGREHVECPRQQARLLVRDPIGLTPERASTLDERGGRGNGGSGNGQAPGAWVGHAP